MYILVIFCSRVHRTLYRIPKGSQFANIGVVVVYYKISWKENKNDYFFGYVAQCGAFGACELYLDCKNAIHNKLGCPEATRGQNRG